MKIHSQCIRTIREGDPKWHINDGIVVTGRAGLEISERCPNTWKPVIMDAIAKGYIKPVAYMKDTELMWETLCE